MLRKMEDYDSRRSLRDRAKSLEIEHSPHGNSQQSVWSVGRCQHKR
jgi:hypothetical protein